MDQRAEKVEVAIEEVRDSAPLPDGSGVVVETGAVVDGTRHDTVIEVRHDDVAAVTIALLNAEERDRSPGEVAAIRCLGAGVVHWTSLDSVRFHLQFESGQVLPVEMSRDAAVALCRGLFEHTGEAVGGFQRASEGGKPRSD